MTGTPHVAVLIDRYVPVVGGAQQVVHQIVQRLAQRGMRITVLTRRVSPDLPAEEVRDGVRIVRLGHHPRRIASKLRCLRESVRWIRANQADLDAMLAVPTALVTDLLATYLASRATGVPYAVRTTALHMFDGMLSWNPRQAVAGGMAAKLITPPPLWRAALTRAVAIVAQSQPVYDRLDAHGFANAQLCIGGADPQRFHPAPPAERSSLRRRLGLPDDRLIFITTGRYIPEKNHLAFVQAAHRLHDDHPSRVLALVIGGTEHGQPSPTQRQLKRYVADHRLASVVRFGEDVLNVEDYLRAADVFVQPTAFDEGLSNALMEAMMCGLALVASDIPQTAAALPGGDGAAILVPPQDVAALAEGMARMLTDDALRIRSGDALAEHARRTYSLDRVVDFYDELLRGMAATSPPPRAAQG